MDTKALIEKYSNMVTDLKEQRTRYYESDTTYALIDSEIATLLMVIQDLENATPRYKYAHQDPVKELEVFRKALHDACKQLADDKWPLPSWMDGEDEQGYVDYFISRVRMDRRNEHRNGGDTK